LKNIWRSTILIFTTLSLAAIPLAMAPVQVVAQPATITYNLYATDGYWTMADGTKLYSYGFIGGRVGQPLNYINQAGTLVSGVTLPTPTPGPVSPTELPLQGNAQFPAPIIYCETGDTVIINLKNLGVANKKAPNDPHSIHLHALDVDAANDGVPETSIAAIPANAKLPGAGNVVVYMFTPSYPGTYMYHCHQEADIHVTMGMYGAMVVYNTGDAAAATGPGTGLGGTLHGQAYDKDYVMLLSDTDTRIHSSEAGMGANFNMVNYSPQYWFINGISFPQTIHAGFVAPASFANWILAHPGYDPFITGSVGAGQRVLLRMINMGFETQPMHMHGFHFTVIGTDQRGLTHPYEKNTINIGSGETYEIIVDFGDWTVAGAAGTYHTGTYTRYDPLTGAPLLNTVTGSPAIPDPFAPGFAYVGGPVVGPPIPPVQGTGGLPPELPPTLGQYFPFHNHDDYKATNNGVYPGGQFTMLMPVP